MRKRTYGLARTDPLCAGSYIGRVARDTIKSANRVLAALPTAAYERVRKHLEPVALPVNAAVYEAGAPSRYLLFPTTGIVSLVQAVASGDSTEVAVVGREGVVGISTFLGGEGTTSRATVQAAGHGVRLPMREAAD